jgi:hypothetical protein
MMPSINDARALTQKMGLKGAIIVGFAPDGKFSVASYGATKNFCAALRGLVDRIADHLANEGVPEPPK